MKRGEIWLVDLGYTGKVRPVLIISLQPTGQDRALLTYVIRTTSLRGTEYEVTHRKRGMKLGAFDAQGIGTTDRSRFIRKLGEVEMAVMQQVEAKIKVWLGL